MARPIEKIGLLCLGGVLGGLVFALIQMFAGFSRFYQIFF